jgi:hypothetical protein
MTERELLTKVERYLKSKGIWYYKASDKWTSGIPDLIICLQGRFVGIELKTKKGVVSKIQNYIGDKLTKAGGIWAVCRSVNEVEEICQSLIS